MTTAVILPPTPASFLKIAGLPIVQRAALSALRGGCDSVVVLGGDEGSRLREVFQQHRLTRDVRVVETGESDDIGGQVAVVLPSDWFLTPGTVRRVLETEVDGVPLLFELSGSRQEGLGIALCRVESLDQVTGWMGKANPPVSPTDGAGPGAVRLPLETDADGPIEDAAAAREAEQALIKTVRAATAETDGPIARLDRGLSTRLSRVLVRTALRPNHITAIGTVVGLLGAWCFAHGAYWSNLLGAVLFWCAVIIDGCDGEVARLKFQETRYGGLYDVVTDNIVHVAVFIGLGMGYFGSVAGIDVRLFIGLLVGGFLSALAATYFCLLRHPPVQHLQPRSTRGRIRQRLLRGFEALMNRDFAYLLLLLAVIDRLGWFLWGAVFGTYVYAAGLGWVYRWRDAG